MTHFFPLDLHYENVCKLAKSGKNYLMNFDFSGFKDWVNILHAWQHFANSNLVKSIFPRFSVYSVNFFSQCVIVIPCVSCVVTSTTRVHVLHRSRSD